MTQIKNCGLKSREAIDAAASTGANFAGFVHYHPSPRHVELSELAPLIHYAKPKIRTVVVVVEPLDAMLDDLMALAKPDFLQLHDVLSPTRIFEIRERYAIPIITAIAVHNRNDLRYAPTLEVPSAHVMFDAKSPGSGQPFDWGLLQHIKLAKPWFLAGGLTPENVAEAIQTTHAPIVDVSSGIESAPGIKSLEKIAAFNAAVLQAAHA